MLLGEIKRFADKKKCKLIEDTGKFVGTVLVRVESVPHPEKTAPIVTKLGGNIVFCVDYHE